MASFDIVVTDRTIVDVIAYTQVAGFHDLANNMIFFAESYISIYKQIFFRKISKNEFCHADGIRETKDRRFRREVEETMEALYAMLFMGTREESERLYYA